MMKKNTMTNDEFCSLAGKLLIAMPNIDDNRFDRAVIYVSAHTQDNGAMGIVINKPAEKISFFDILEQIGVPHVALEKQVDVLWGGPDQMTRGFMLHSNDYKAEHQVSVHEMAAVTTSERILLDTALGKGPDKLILALGCSTWVDGQLEEEIMSNIWLTADATEELLFHTPYEERWEKALATLGVDAPLLAGEFGKA
ncbi:MAG: YqgE/AlgH family protein [Alphaproteobacteria bacterium]|nr:YqgE/AlgH family protein [Alphaproteobacteria bacterium]